MDGTVCGFIKNGTDKYYYYKNLQGDIISVTNDSGAAVATYGYDAWGKLLTVSGNTEIANLNPFRYRGYYYDSETQIYYLNSRYYDPKTCRFINADDPNVLLAKDNHNYNLFAYCNNNPLMFIDKYGNFAFLAFLVIALLVVAVVKITTALITYHINKKRDITAGMIFGQDNPPVATMHFGFDILKNNGCEIIAIYNAMQLLGKGVALSKLISEAEIFCSMAMGLLGSNPRALSIIFQKHKIKYESYFFTKSCKKAVKPGDVTVLSFWNDRHNPFNQLHTVCAKCVSDNTYQVYNYGGNDTAFRIMTFESILNSIRYNGRFIIGYILK